MKVEAFRGQDFNKMKRELIQSGRLFVDPEFPPDDTSLFFSPKQQTCDSSVEWKRPGEITQNPRLFVAGVSGDDVVQGKLGNCWFVTACSALTHYKELWTKVIPDADSQEWDPNHTDRYCGIFHFCFWRFGRWVDVVIDDMLATQNGQLIFARSKTRNEFWSALLEKAFAKLNGCYESLIGGSLAEALVDITGGVPEMIDLTVGAYKTDGLERFHLFNELKETFDNKSLMAAAIVANSKEEIEQPLECGLLRGHSYAISAIRKITLDAQLHGKLFEKLFADPEKVLMVRLRNPWGEKEWNGAWSDGAPEWDMISKEQRKELGLKIEEDGEFWMTFDDFVKNFTDISVCHQINTRFFSLTKTYVETVFLGVWYVDAEKDPSKHRAGGCINFKESFLLNPQYRFDVDEMHKEDVMFSLMQRDIRERRRQNTGYLTIGIHVMRVENNRVYRLHQIMPTVATSEYTNTRSVFLRLKHLKRGRYVIVPTTFAPNEEGQFMLRMFTHFNPHAKELILDKPKSSLFACCRQKHACATRVAVKRASGLRKDDGTHATHAYCVVKCEGERARTAVFESGVATGDETPVEPHWENFSAIFLRKRPEEAIVIEVYNAETFRDAFLGCAMVACPVTNEMKASELPLTAKPTKGGETPAARSGKLFVEISTFDDLTHF